MNVLNYIEEHDLFPREATAKFNFGSRETVNNGYRFEKQGVTCKVRAKKYKSYKRKIGKIASNNLNRKFEDKRSNEKWVSDVTQFHIKDKKLYLSPILDLYNGKIITYTLFERLTF